MKLTNEEREAIIAFRIHKALDTLKEAEGIASLCLLVSQSLSLKDQGDGFTQGKLAISSWQLAKIGNR